MRVVTVTIMMVIPGISLDGTCVKADKISLSHQSSHSLSGRGQNEYGIANEEVSKIRSSALRPGALNPLSVTAMQPQLVSTYAKAFSEPITLTVRDLNQTEPVVFPTTLISPVVHHHSVHIHSP